MATTTKNQKGASGRRSFKDVLLHYLDRYSVTVGLLLVSTIMAFLSPYFLSTYNLLSVVRQVAVVGLLAIGQTLVILLAQIDLSVGSILALSGVVAAMALKAGWALPLAIAAALAAGAAIGLINGLLVTKGKVPAFITTLGMMGVARGIGLILTDGFPISGFGQSFGTIGSGEILKIPVPMIILLFFTFVMSVVLGRTRFGRNLYAIGGSKKAALYSGIRVQRHIIIAFIISGLFAAAGGIVLTSRLDSAETVAGVGYELSAIAGVVIGGTSLMGGVGTVLGTLLGTLFIGIVTNGLTLMAVSAYWQQVVQGAIIILAVLIDHLRKGVKDTS